MTSTVPVDRRGIPADTVPPVADTTRRQWPMMIGLAMLVVLAAYGGTILGLSRQWWGYLNHGFALVALVGWVVWRDRVLLFTGNEPWWPAVFVVLGGTALWFVCAVAGIQSIEQVALMVVLLAWTLGVLGRGKQRRLAELGVYLAFALPILGLTTGGLQLLTVTANSVLLWMVGLQASISGTYITIPEGVFEVAAGCSGLNYFTSGMTIGFAYAEMIPLTLRGRLLAVGLMGILSLVSNWIRVFLLILIGHWTKMQSSLMSDHVWFGWVIFAVMVVVFLVLSPRIEKRHGLTAAAAAGAARTQIGDIAPRAVAAGPSPMIAMWSLTAIAVLGPVGAVLIERAPLDPSPAAIADLAVGSDWRAAGITERKPLVYGDSTTGRPWMPQYVGADRHSAQRWVRQSDTVQVDRLTFSGRDHRHKLLAQGNVMAHGRNLLMDRAIGINEGTRVRSLRQAVVRIDSTENLAVVYWFRVGNSSTGVPLVGRMLQVSASLRRSAPSELVTVSTPCGANCDTAFGTLQEFVMGQDNGAREAQP